MDFKDKKEAWEVYRLILISLNRLMFKEVRKMFKNKWNSLVVLLPKQPVKISLFIVAENTHNMMSSEYASGFYSLESTVALDRVPWEAK